VPTTLLALVLGPIELWPLLLEAVNAPAERLSRVEIYPPLPRTTVSQVCSGRMAELKRLRRLLRPQLWPKPLRSHPLTIPLVRRSRHDLPPH